MLKLNIYLKSIEGSFVRKSVSGFLIGYYGDIDVYRVRLSEENKVIISKHVTFTQERIVQKKVVMENILQINTNESVEQDKVNYTVSIQYESNSKFTNHDLDNIRHHHYNFRSKNQLLTYIYDDLQS